MTGPPEGRSGEPLLNKIDPSCGGHSPYSAQVRHLSCMGQPLGEIGERDAGGTLRTRYGALVHRSTRTSVVGVAQQMRVLPGAGGSSGGVV